VNSIVQEILYQPVVVFDKQLSHVWTNSEEELEKITKVVIGI
jgi:hypothetical protein